MMSKPACSRREPKFVSVAVSMIMILVTSVDVEHILLNGPSLTPQRHNPIIENFEGI